MQTICIKEEALNVLNSLPLSVAYVPDQCFTSPVSPEKALEMGTAWNELYRPYNKGGRM
jgi:hypothetical protein